MKTEYRPISMRCTKEQFDSIKDRIPLPMKHIDDFKIFNILINYFCFLDDNNVVTNLSEKDNNLDIGTIVNFDGELFLDCCGREKETFSYDEIKVSLYDEFRLWYDLRKGKHVGGMSFDEVIKELIKDKVWKGSELEVYVNSKGVWCKALGELYRIKQKSEPDYSKEIEALEQKAKENGQKVIIKFE